MLKKEVLLWLTVNRIYNSTIQFWHFYIYSMEAYSLPISNMLKKV